MVNKLFLRPGKDRANEKGFILLTTYVVVTVVMVFCFAFFARSSAFMQAVERNHNKIVAFNLAEAGVDFALVQLAADPNYAGTNGYVSMVADSVQGGFGVTVTIPDDDPLTRVIQSTGFSPDNNIASRSFQSSALTVYGLAQPSGAFNYGIFAEADINLTGNAFIDSYNSDNGPYGAGNSDHNGDIGTNSTAADTVSLNGNVMVDGDVTVGPEGDPNTAVKVTGNGMVTGTLAAAVTPSVHNPPTTTVASSGALSINGNDTQHLLPGTYRFDSIKITGNGTLSITGPVKIYVDGTIKVAGNGIANQSSAPPDCLIYATGPSDIQIAGNGDLHAGVYAPLAHVKNTGNGAIYGAVISETYNQTGNGAVHFDEALKDVAGSENSKMSVTAWQEQNTLAWGTGS